MSTHAEGTFTLAGWDERTVQELAPPTKLTYTTITQEFAGALSATGTAESVMAYAADGTATFTGYQTFDGELDGRKGTFLVRTEGSYDGTTARTRLTVVEGSGTGELAGLAGTGTADVATPPGAYTLDYTLG